MKKLLQEPVFLIGLILRFLLIFGLTAKPILELYVPFLEHSLEWSLNPWGSWLVDGGNLIAFPYGYAMLFWLLPFILLAKLIHLPLTFGYSFALLFTDLLFLLLLDRMYPNRGKLVFYIYWLSPIIILATYVLGYNDLIPVFFLALSYYLIRGHQFKLSGLSISLALSAKLSMMLALPFVFVYFFHNRPLRQFLSDFCIGLGIGVSVLWIPFLSSESALKMLFSNPEMFKLYALKLQMVNELSIYLVPVVYFLVLYYAWRVKRLNYNLFTAFSGTAFLLLVLMTPASPGWFIWVVPLLVDYQMMSDRTSFFLVGFFSLLYVFSSLKLFSITSSEYLLAVIESIQLSGHAQSLTHTLMVVIGIILAMRLWREAIVRNDYFRLSRKPFVIGIAGDSGAGKDTFTDALEGLFGRHSVTKVSGDNYHLWDRQKPMWQVMTHLNPMANNLEAFSRDVMSLVDGKSILAAHYDHTSGRMSHPQRIDSNDLIIASGLHALYLPLLREIFDLTIYLDIDEDLRKYFKITRDVTIRGHSVEQAEASLERREEDSIKFIRPQANFADLVLSLKPIHPRLLEGDYVARKMRYKISARSRYGFNELALIRALVGICGLHVDMLHSENPSEIELTIEGETTSEDVAMAARLVCPEIFEFLDLYPRWQDGMTGLMQLITISHIQRALSRRFYD